VQTVKQLISKDNWTPFIDPINDVMGRMEGYGGKNYLKPIFNSVWPFLVIDEHLS
jgi:hypothetical protein